MIAGNDELSEPFSYRGIFRHNVRLQAPWKTGGRANGLYLDIQPMALRAAEVLL